MAEQEKVADIKVSISQMTPAQKSTTARTSNCSLLQFTCQIPV